MPATSQGVVRVGFRYAAPACRLLAAGHLQGPAKRVTTDMDHLLSLVDPIYQHTRRRPEAVLVVSSVARVQSTLRSLRPCEERLGTPTWQREWAMRRRSALRRCRP